MLFPTPVQLYGLYATTLRCVPPVTQGINIGIYKQPKERSYQAIAALFNSMRPAANPANPANPQVPNDGVKVGHQPIFLARGSRESSFKGALESLLSFTSEQLVIRRMSNVFGEGPKLTTDHAWSNAWAQMADRQI